MVAVSHFINDCSLQIDCLLRSSIFSHCYASNALVSTVGHELLRLLEWLQLTFGWIMREDRWKSPPLFPYSPTHTRYCRYIIHPYGEIHTKKQLQTFVSFGDTDSKEKLSTVETNYPGILVTKMCQNRNNQEKLVLKKSWLIRVKKSSRSHWFF